MHPKVEVKSSNLGLSRIKFLENTSERPISEANLSPINSLRTESTRNYYPYKRTFSNLLNS